MKNNKKNISENSLDKKNKKSINVKKDDLKNKKTSNTKKTDEKDIKSVDIKKVDTKDINTPSENPLDEKNTTINYSKYNSFIFKTSNNNSFNKKQNNIYNTLKFGLALLLVVFILISLWMSTIWQKDTLTGLGVNLGGMDIDGILNVLMPSPPPLEWKDPIPTILKYMMAKNIIDFTGLSVNIHMINSLIAIGFISLVIMVPVLVFKNGTLYSTIFLSLGLLFLITLMSLFFFIISEQSELVSLSREGNYLAGIHSASLNAENPGPALTAEQKIRLDVIFNKIIAIVGTNW